MTLGFCARRYRAERLPAGAPRHRRTGTVPLARPQGSPDARSRSSRGCACRRTRLAHSSVTRARRPSRSPRPPRRARARSSASRCRRSCASRSSRSIVSWSDRRPDRPAGPYCAVPRATHGPRGTRPARSGGGRCLSYGCAPSHETARVRAARGWVRRRSCTRQSSGRTRPSGHARRSSSHAPYARVTQRYAASPAPARARRAAPASPGCTSFSTRTRRVTREGTAPRRPPRTTPRRFATR